MVTSAAITRMTQAAERPVLRCWNCRLVQFVTMNEHCRKCRKPLIEPVAEPVAEVPMQESREPKPVFRRVLSVQSIERQLAYVILLARQTQGLSQQDLARKMKVARTYISKVERMKALPTLAGLTKFADALQLRPLFMLQMAEALHQTFTDQSMEEHPDET